MREPELTRRMALYVNTHDPQLRQQIRLEASWIGHEVADKYRRALGKEASERICFEGLERAIDSFSMPSDLRFASFAKWTIFELIRCEMSAKGAQVIRRRISATLTSDDDT